MSATSIRPPRGPTAEQLALTLGGKHTGPNRWQARCPAHNDKTPSLSISLGRKVNIVFVCRAGCPQDEVIKALRRLNLWHEPHRQRLTVAQRRRYALRVQKRGQAELWAIAARIMAEAALRTMASDDPDRWVYTEMLANIRAGSERLNFEFSYWQHEHPTLTQAMVEAGRLSRDRTQTKLAGYIAKEARRAR